MGNQIFERVKDIIADQFGLDPSLITLNASLKNDLGLDEDDLLWCIAGLEEGFKINFPDDLKYGKLAVREVVEYLSSHRDEVEKPIPSNEKDSNRRMTDLKEVEVLKSKKQNEEFQNIIEKRRKKREGLFGKLKGIEEEIEISRKLFFPYWIVKYNYSQEKGLFRKKLEEFENSMVLNGFYGIPCSDENNVLEICSKLGTERASVGSADVLVTPLIYEEALKILDGWVSKTRNEIDTLLHEAADLQRMIDPDIKVLDELRSRASYIRDRIDYLVKQRQTQSVVEGIRGGYRSLRHGSFDFDNIKSSIRHGLWSGRSGGGTPVESFINRSLRPSDIDAMEEEELNYTLEEVKGMINEYEHQLSPYINNIEKNHNKAQALKEKIRASTNFPKKAQEITRYLSGSLVFYPYWCVKYQGTHRKGHATTRWMILDGLTGSEEKSKVNTIKDLFEKFA